MPREILDATTIGIVAGHVSRYRGLQDRPRIFAEQRRAAVVARYSDADRLHDRIHGDCIFTQTREPGDIGDSMDPSMHGALWSFDGGFGVMRDFRLMREF